jgi:hypothetical protein
LPEKNQQVGTTYQKENPLLFIRGKPSDQHYVSEGNPSELYQRKTNQFALRFKG